jgi:hypothetical protein
MSPLGRMKQVTALAETVYGEKSFCGVTYYLNSLKVIEIRSPVNSGSDFKPC